MPADQNPRSDSHSMICLGNILAYPIAYLRGKGSRVEYNFTSYLYSFF